MSFESLGSNQFVCGRSSARSVGAPPAKGGVRPFPVPGAETRWSRDRLADWKHVRIEIALDFESRSVRGVVHHTFVPILDGLQTLELDCVELDVRSVRLKGGGRVTFESVDGRLRVRFARPLRAGRAATISVEYRGTPRRGLYFCGPDEHRPDTLLQAWTQGQDEDSRHWFPCWDYPNQKATTEVLATVPDGMKVLSNGRLVKRTRDRRRGLTTWHWSQKIPHVSYLVTLVAGEFETWESKWRDVPLTVYAPAGRLDDAKRACGRTARMMAHFSKVTGVAYPYEKYDQVFVQDFIFGGMENTTATTLTDTALLDARSFLDVSMDGLVAHELAHQWWGDLVTCRDWSHGWLNEGFATYFEQVWREEDLGQEEYDFHLLELRDAYLAEDGGHYRRAIVCNRYRDPVELFDRHLYQKGALVLHMLRRVLGDDLFWKSIRHYIATHREQNVETDDLRRAVESVTGRNLEGFFDQWVFRAGHPELKATYAWDDGKKIATITVKQAHKVDEETALFRMPLRVVFGLARGRTETREVEMRDVDGSWRFDLPSRPKWVNLDPGFGILKTLDFTPPREMLVAQLSGDGDVIGRVHAAGCLGKDGSPEAVKALAACLGSDAFWGVRGAAAAALGKARTAAARDALLRHVATDHPKVRRAVVQALGEWREDARVSKALTALVTAGDPSVLVEAHAARSLGLCRADGAFELLARAFDERDSWNDSVRSGCLGGMAGLKDLRGLEVARRAARPSASNSLRGAGVAALGALAKVKDAPKDDLVEELARLVRDPWLRVQMVACDALAALRDPRALPELDRAAQHDLDGRVRRSALEAARKVREGGSREDEIRALRDDLEKLREEIRKVRDQAAAKGK